MLIKARKYYYSHYRPGGRGNLTPSLPSPLGDCIVLEGKAVIPAKAGIQVIEIAKFYN